MPHLGRHPNSLNTVAGGFRTARGEEAWRPVHGSSWEAEIQRQSNTSDWGSDPRMRVQEPGHKSHTEAGRAMLWVTGRKGSQVEGRQAPTYLDGNLPRAPQYVTNNCSQVEYILLYFVDWKTHFFCFKHLKCPESGHHLSMRFG